MKLLLFQVWPNLNSDVKKWWNYLRILIQKGLSLILALSRERGLEGARIVSESEDLIMAIKNQLELIT